MSFDADLIACAQLVERGDPDRFAATMAAPVEARKVLFPVYAFNVEVSRAPWVTQEAIIAEMRLQWWTDALEEIASGGLVRRHEVVTSLAHVLDAKRRGCCSGLWKRASGMFIVIHLKIMRHFQSISKTLRPLSCWRRRRH